MTRWLILIAVLCLLTPGLTSAEARDDPGFERQWTVYWRQFAPYYAELDGSFACLPQLERGHRNSSGLDPRTYEKDQTFDLTTDDGRGNQTTQTLRKPKAEVTAALEALPNFEPGSFGTIESAQVSRILSEDRVELADVRLIDPQQVEQDREADREAMRREVWGQIEDAFRMGWRRGGPNQGRVSDRADELREAVDWRFEQRDALLRAQREYSGRRLILQGFQTSPMIEGERWPAERGVEIAIIKAEDRQTYAIPLAVARRGLTESRFAAMLETRGLTRARFVEIVKQQRLASPMSYKPGVLAAIEGADAKPADDPQDLPGGDVLLAP